MKNNLLYKIKVDEHITLQILTVKDAQVLFQLVKKNATHLKPWMPWVKTTKSSADTKAFIFREFEKFKTREGFNVSIYYDGKLIGSGGFNKIDKINMKGSIGYWISKEYEGRGIMTKTVAKMIEIGKKKYHLRRIDITMDPKNNRSQAIPKRLGFIYEGTLRHNLKISGKFHDSEMWSLVFK